MKKILNKIKPFIVNEFKKFAKALPIVILIFVLYGQCTKLGSKLMLVTPGIEWYLPEDSETTKDELLAIANDVHNLLQDKGIETKDFNVNVIICGSAKEFLWKSLVWDDQTLGVTRWLLGNTTINKSSIKNDKMDLNDSKLSETIAHELCHIYLSKKLSLLDFILLKAWKDEGFAEYISEHSTLDIEKGLSLFMTNNKAEIEKTDRDKILYFYFTSRLKTDYLLGYKKMPFDEFIDTDYDEELLEEEIRTALKNETYKFPSRTMELNKVGEWRTSQIHSRIFIY